MTATVPDKGFLTIFEEEQNEEIQVLNLGCDDLSISAIRLVSYNSLNLELLELQNSYAYTDVRIDCFDGYFRVHHSILVAASPTIDQLYDRNNRNNASHNNDHYDDYSLDEKGHRKINSIQFSVRDVAEILVLFYVGETVSCASTSHRNRTREILGFFRAELSKAEMMIPLCKFDPKVVDRKRKKFDNYFLRFSSHMHKINQGFERENFISVTGKIQGAVSEVYGAEEGERVVVHYYDDSNLLFFPCNSRDSESHKCPRCWVVLSDINEFIAHAMGCFRSEIFDANKIRNDEVDSGIVISVSVSGSTQKESASSNSRVPRSKDTEAEESLRHKSVLVNAIPLSSVTYNVSSGTNQPGTSGNTVESPKEHEEEEEQNISVTDPNNPTESIDDHLHTSEGMRVCEICKCLLINYDVAIAHVKKFHLSEQEAIQSDYVRVSQMAPPFNPEKDGCFRCTLKDCGKAFVTPAGFMHHYETDHKITHMIHFEADPFPSCAFCQMKSNEQVSASITEFFRHVFDCFQRKKAKMRKGWKPHKKSSKTYSAPDPTSDKWYKQIDFRSQSMTENEDPVGVGVPRHRMKLRDRSRSLSVVQDQVPAPPIPNAKRPTSTKASGRSSQGGKNTNVKSKKSTSRNRKLSPDPEFRVQIQNRNKIQRDHVSRRDQHVATTNANTLKKSDAILTGEIVKREQSVEASPSKVMKRPRFASTPVPIQKWSSRPQKDITELNGSPIAGPSVNPIIHTQYEISCDSESDGSIVSVATSPNATIISRGGNSGKNLRTKGIAVNPAYVFPVSPDSSGSALHLRRV